MNFEIHPYIVKKALKNLVVIITTCLFYGSSTCDAQKYAFTRYDIEDGLIQSQVNKFSQDKAHRLWIGTLGGACRFDGKDFTSYSKENGLINNFIYTVYCDAADRVWFGTQKGISCLYNKKIINFAIPAGVKRTWVTHIVEDGAGILWFTMDNKLFKISNNVIQNVDIPEVKTLPVTSIAINKAGTLHAFVYSSGVFALKNGIWQMDFPFNDALSQQMVKKMVFDRFDAEKVFLLTYNSVLVGTNHQVNAYPGNPFGSLKKSLLNLEQDAEGNLWIGSENGAYYIKKQQTIHFDSKNGFTDVSVSDIFCDRDNNIWLATWGGGIYRYEGDGHVILNQSAGLQNADMVMGIVHSNNNILLGTNNNGILKYDGQKLSAIGPPGGNPNSKLIQCLYTDKNNVVWIGTALGGLWRLNGNHFEMIKDTEGRIVNAITADDNGTIWLAVPLGCYYYEHGTINKLPGVSGFVSSLLAIGKDTLLLGTQDGLIMVAGKKTVNHFTGSELGSSSIYCMLKTGDNIIIGTAERGLFAWNSKTGSIKNYDTKKGLNSNTIYSLVSDDKGIVWAGTGRGINRVILDKEKNQCSILGDGESKKLIVEANQNAAANVNGQVWFGTTKGIVIYNTNKIKEASYKPHIIIQTASLIGEKNAGAAAKDDLVLNDGAQIPYHKNHLTIGFLGIYLKNPEEIVYQYQLVGLDNEFCAPVKNNTVDYPSLPTGKYTFEVKAITAGGITSDNVARFSFEITPPFYQTMIFKAGAILSLILLGFVIQSYWHQLKVKRQLLIEVIKRDEKLKIRQQTAEDFHDDLGNKLTRISILSDMLGTKLDADRADQQKLVDQIKQNTSALYTGTKDILWALDPKSDNLFEILTHIRDFGIELFQDIPVEFEFENIKPELARIKLPMEYSRNMPMIFKELLNNVLKHSGASKVTMTLQTENSYTITIILHDNGKGFNVNQADRGHGITNIKSRAKRIGADVEILSDPTNGTTAKLKFAVQTKL